MFNRYRQQLSPTVKYWVFLLGIIGVIFVVILGSFAFMTLGRTGYLEALTYIVFVIAGALLAMSDGLLVTSAVLGSQSVDFEALTLPSGVYLYRITAQSTGDRPETFTALKKMVLMK